MSKNILVLLTLIVSSLSFAQPLMVDMGKLDKSYAIDYIKYSDGGREIHYLTKEDVPTDNVGVALDCIDPAAAKLKDFNSIWLWNTRKIINNPEQAVLVAKDLGVSGVYIQLVKDLEELTAFIDLANQNNIKVTALSGEPDYIYNWDGIDRELDRINKFNSTHKNKISGIQYDIEPHTLNNFSIEKEMLLEKLDGTVRHINENKKDLTLSIVVPFWYSSLKLYGKPLLDSLYKNVDYITTMSYRTKYQDILNISNDSLCLAAKNGKKLQIGIEHLHLANETHNTIISDDVRYISSKNEGFIYDKDVEELKSKKYIQSYQIPSSNISFRGDEKGLREILKTHPEYLAFKGWAVNGLIFDDH